MKVLPYLARALVFGSGEVNEFTVGDLAWLGVGFDLTCIDNLVRIDCSIVRPRPSLTSIPLSKT